MAQRTVEAYPKAGVRPRWMERITEIDQAIAAQRRRLGRAHRQLRAEWGEGPGFARRRREYVGRCRFDELSRR